MTTKASTTTIVLIASGELGVGVADLEAQGARCLLVDDIEGALGLGADVLVFPPRVADRLGVALAAEPPDRRPRLVMVTRSCDVDAAGVAGSLDAVVMVDAPLGALSLAAGLCPRPAAPFAPVELIEAGSLGGSPAGALMALERAVAAAFGVPECAALLPARPAPAGQDGAEVAWEEMTRYWKLSARARTGVLSGAPSGPGSRHVESYLAAPIAADGVVYGELGIVTSTPRLFDRQEQAALAAVARRAGAEMRWRSAHQRVVGELDRLRDGARLDPELEVWNRRALERLAAMKSAVCERRKNLLSAIVIDVTGLQAINEKYGLLGGDAVLRRVADTVSSTVRADDLVGRFAGDKLAIVLIEIGASRATLVAERIQAALAAQPLEVLEGRTIEVVAGVTTAKSPDERPDRLLARAAQAARLARESGDRIRSIAVHRDEEVTAPSLRLGARCNGLEANVTLGGTYRLIHEISRGGMGVVYRAEDIGLGRPAAVKMLRPDLASDRAMLEGFRAEAEILAHLHHENLVKVYSFGTHGDDTYFAMELVEGESLEGAIARFRRERLTMPLERLERVVAQIGSALDALHARGVVHRDVKPANVLLDPFRERAVLVDVGIARRHGDDSAPAGTPGYVAPEVLGGAPATPRSDVYGLAATTYAVLTLHQPWGEPDNMRELLLRQTCQVPRRPSSFDPRLEPLDVVVLGALALDPERRPPSAGAFARALGQALRDGPLASTEQGGAPSYAPGDTMRAGGVAGDIRLAGEPRGLASQPGVDLAPDSTASEVAATFDAPAATCRAVVFRSVAGVLGVRQAEKWRGSLLRSWPQIGAAMGDSTSPLSWVPAALLRQLLHQGASTGREPLAFARELGRATLRTSFRRFFPVSAATLEPSQTLAAFDVIWGRYQRWGSVSVIPMAGKRATVWLDGSAGDPLVWAFVAGMIEQLVTMSGAVGVEIDGRDEDGERGPRAVFQVAWSEPSSPPSERLPQ